ESAGRRVRARGGLGALGLGENATEKLVAPAVERPGDPLDVAQVRADADDHRATAIATNLISRKTIGPTAKNSSTGRNRIHSASATLSDHRNRSARSVLKGMAAMGNPQTKKI